MTSPEDWSIRATPDGQFFLLHGSCQWQSNPQTRRNMADLLRWVENHEVTVHAPGLRTEMTSPEERAVIDAAMAWAREHPGRGLGEIFPDELTPLRNAARDLVRSRARGDEA